MAANNPPAEPSDFATSGVDVSPSRGNASNPVQAIVDTPVETLDTPPSLAQTPVRQSGPATVAPPAKAEPGGKAVGP